MALSNGQKNELVVLDYFCPQEKPIGTDDDLVKFFEWSSNGLHKKYSSPLFDYLKEAKRWPEIHIEMYEKDLLIGVMPYYTILGGESEDIAPREVVDFLKSNMFRGIDSEAIEKCYQDILQNTKQ